MSLRHGSRAVGIFRRGRQVARALPDVPGSDTDTPHGNIRLGRQIEDALARRSGWGPVDPFQLPIVVACRDRISQTVAQMPLVQYRGRQPTQDQPPIVVRPDPHEPRSSTMSRLAYNLSGPGYAWLITDAWYADEITPSAVRVVDHDEAHGLFDSAGRLTDVIHRGRRYNPAHREATLVQYRTAHVGPPDANAGPIAGCRRVVEYLCALWQMAGSFWEAGFPSVALVFDQALTKDQRVELKASTLAATSRRHEPWLIERGGRLEAIGANATEAQLVDSLTTANTEVARVFGVTPSLVNVQSGYSLTYSTVEGELGQWLKLGLVGYLNPIEVAWSDLRPYGTSVQFDASVLLRTDIAARYSAYDTAYGKWLSADEIRAAEGLPPTMPTSPATVPTEALFDMPNPGGIAA